MSLPAIAVPNYCDSGNVGAGLPEVCFFPIGRKTFRLDKEDIRAQTALAMGHYRGELPNARSRAGTMGMRQHDQGCTILRRLNPAVSGPLPRCLSGDTWSVLVAPK